MYTCVIEQQVKSKCFVNPPAFLVALRKKKKKKLFNTKVKLSQLYFDCNPGNHSVVKPHSYTKLHKIQNLMLDAKPAPVPDGFDGARLAVLK